jgi:hypothetical protein
MRTMISAITSAASTPKNARPIRASQVSRRARAGDEAASESLLFESLIVSVASIADRFARRSSKSLLQLAGFPRRSRSTLSKPPATSRARGSHARARSPRVELPPAIDAPTLRRTQEVEMILVAAEFVLSSLVSVALASASSSALAPQDGAKLKPAHHAVLGEGDHFYRWESGWAKLPEGMKFGNTHGCIVIDAHDNVYMNTDTDNAVIVFDKDGKYLRSFGKEWRGGLHGMVLRKEGDKEFIYFTHTQRGVAGKMTLDGEVLWTIGCPMKTGFYKNEGEYHPTSVAVAPNGDVFVADGYGKSWVHKFSQEQKYLSSFGGPGDGESQMASPHGIWMDTRADKPILLVADREHHRIQRFELDGKLIDIIQGDLRRPSNFGQRGTDIAVADLEGRVTILDKDNKVVTHLGDNADPAKRANNGVPPDQWVEGQFVAPHCARWDSQGNLYVLDWVSAGRITKLARTKSP